MATLLTSPSLLVYYVRSSRTTAIIQLTFTIIAVLSAIFCFFFALVGVVVKTNSKLSYSACGCAVLLALSSIVSFVLWTSVSKPLFMLEFDSSTDVSYSFLFIFCHHFFSSYVCYHWGTQVAPSQNCSRSSNWWAWIHKWGHPRPNSRVWVHQWKHHKLDSSADCIHQWGHFLLNSFLRFLLLVPFWSLRLSYVKNKSSYIVSSQCFWMCSSRISQCTVEKLTLARFLLVYWVRYCHQNIVKTMSYIFSGCLVG